MVEALDLQTSRWDSDSIPLLCSDWASCSHTCASVDRKVTMGLRESNASLSLGLHRLLIVRGLGYNTL